jgi:hypothetical protein
MLKKQVKIQFQKDGQKNKVVVMPATYKVDQELKATYAVAYRKAITLGVATRSSMLELLKKENIWGDSEEEKLMQKSIEAAAYEAQLRIATEKNDKDAQKLAALRLVSSRSALYELIQIKSAPLEHTAESIAEDVKIDKFISLSTFSEDGKPYFTTHDDFLNRRSEADSIKIYNAVIEELSRDNLEILRKLPENVWLVSNGLMDENGKVNEKELVDTLIAKETEVKEKKVNS